MASLELFGREVLPEFIERDEKASAQRAKRLAPVIEAAMARRPPDPKADPGYTFGGVATTWAEQKPVPEIVDLASRSDMLSGQQSAVE